MSNIDDKLNEALNIAAAVADAESDQIIATTQEFQTKENTELVIPHDKDPDSDFEIGRANLYKLLDKGNDAIDGILALAKEGEHPRAYEVAGQLIKTVADVSKDLLELQEKLKKIKDVPNTGPKSVTNALFVGSTTELQKLLKGKKQNG
jgi:soluble cytochrome b562